MPASALPLERYGLSIGVSADFVTLRAAHVPAAVVVVPKGRDGLSRGQEWLRVTGRWWKRPLRHAGKQQSRAHPP